MPNHYHPALVLYHQRSSLASEAYRALRTNLIFNRTKNKDQSQAIVITSTHMGEGKSTTAANLSFALAQAKYKTLLIDADMRKPQLHEIFDLETKNCFGRILEGVADYKECLQHTEIPDLDVLTSHADHTSPTELLSSKTLTGLIQKLRSSYDFIIFDTPPIGIVTDAALIASQADGVLFVVGEGAVTAKELKRVKEQLNHIQSPVLGLVYNKASTSTKNYAYYKNDA